MGRAQAQQPWDRPRVAPILCRAKASAYGVALANPPPEKARKLRGKSEPRDLQRNVHP